MKRLLGLVVLAGIIVGAYVLVTTFIKGNEFEEKSIQLMQQQAAKIMTELDKIPGCSGHYSLKTTTFDKDGLFSKVANGRTIYFDKSNNLLDIQWTAEIIDDGNMVIVQPKDIPVLQARLGALALTSCRNS